MAKLTHIFRFPVKSSAPQSLKTVELAHLGLAGDRRWMLVDQASGKFITGREYGALVQLRVDYLTAGDYSRIELSWPNGTPLCATPTKARRRVELWGSTIEAAIAEPAVNRSLSDWLNRDVDLVYFDEGSSRPLDQKYAAPDDQTAFADGFPVLLCTQSSLDALNDKLDAPIPMLRFRPNLVIDGDFPAHAEDHWQQISIGEAIFDVAKPCVRCVFTTVDPDTGIRDPRSEPLNTLKTYRRSDKGICFGVNLIGRTPGALIRLHDPVKLLK